MGHCNNPEFVPEQDPNHWWIDTPYEGINYGKYEGYSAGMRTGEAFGCIHHQPKETT